MPATTHRHPRRRYSTHVLIILTGFLSALYCMLLLLAEAIFGLFVFIGLVLFGIGALLTEYLKKRPRHA